MSVNKILDEHSMDGDIESPFFRLFKNDFNIPGKSALQIIWENVTGTLDGTLEIYLTIDESAGTTDTASKALEQTITISSATNKTDCDLILIEGIIRYCKVKYTKNSITAGDLTVIAAIGGEGR